MTEPIDPTRHDDQRQRDSEVEFPPDTPRIRIDGPEPGREGDIAATALATTLVVGHGPDPASGRALRVAADLARRLHARLQVVHGVDLNDYPIDPDAPDWEQQAQHALDDQRRQVEDALSGTGLGWTYHASRADPVELIAAVAEEHDALMIIVGSRGEGFAATVQRWLSRSVSHGVISAQQRPVLVVPAPS